MADLDPIRQLQHLLDDPGKVLEKISSIRSALDAIKASEPAPLSVTPIAPPASPVKTPSGSEERPFDRLLQTLRDMQLRIEEQLRPLMVQTVQAETDYLHRQAEQNRDALEECRARIDRSIAACFERIDESRQTYAELTRLNRRLAELGASAESLPDHTYSTNPDEMIYARLEKLRLQGKL